ncbi:hypothetical protein V8E55_002560 [Tylopilus felleus]
MLFRMATTPREVIKANKSASQVHCATCYLMAFCNAKAYCSKECQTNDWSRQKTWCTAAERPNGIKTLVETLVCNVTLISMLQVCAALDLDLVNDKKKEIGYKVPFIIRVEVAIEPSDAYSCRYLSPKCVTRCERETQWHSSTPDNDFSITVPLPVYAGPMRQARENDPVVMLSGLTTLCMEHISTRFMNLHIRAEKQNEVKLRVEMTDG